MSYTKDLIDVAAGWLKLNASASGMLKIPRVHVREEKEHLEQIERLEKKMRALDGDLSPGAEQIRAEVRELRARITSENYRKQLEDVRRYEDDLEHRINQVDVSRQTKYDGDPSTLNRLVHGRWCLAWALSGHNVFELSNDFVAAMLLTDPREIRFEDLRAPFPGVLITIPSGFVTGVEGLPYTKLHLSFVDGSWNLFASDGAHVLDTSVAEGEVLDWNLLESLETEGDAVFDDVDARAVRTLRQIAFGMLAYVTAVDRAVEPRTSTRSKKKKASEAAEEGPRARVHDVGRTIKIDPILVKYARAGSREIALQLKHRFIVRGHYKRQAHGPGLRDRKSIWITCYWKGPKEGAALMHTYKPEYQTP